MERCTGEYVNPALLVLSVLFFFLTALLAAVCGYYVRSLEAVTNAKGK